MINRIKNYLSRNQLPLRGDKKDAALRFPFEELNLQADWARIFTRLFSTDDGRLVLTYMRHMATDKVMGPETSEKGLRYQEGRRSFYNSICTLIKQGRQRP